MKLKHFRTISLSALLFLVVFETGFAAQNTDVQVTTTRISDNFYTLEGRGGKVGAIVGNDGVFLVDSQFADMSDKLVAALAAITNQPLKYLVNTHLHGDHVGGNANFAALGVTLFARDQLRAGMANPPNNGNPAAYEALSRVTYDDVVTFHMNGEEIRLIPVRAAHTSGDTLVHFVNNNVLMTGDYYRSLGYPNIDRNNGGSLDGMIAGLGQTLGIADVDTVIMPSHGLVMTRDELRAHRDMLIDLKSRVGVMMANGMSEDQVVNSNVTASHDSQVEQGLQTRERIVRQIYQELSQ